MKRKCQSAFYFFFLNSDDMKSTVIPELLVLISNKTRTTIVHVYKKSAQISEIQVLYDKKNGSIIKFLSVTH